MRKEFNNRALYEYINIGNRSKTKQIKYTGIVKKNDFFSESNDKYLIYSYSYHLSSIVMYIYNTTIN